MSKLPESKGFGRQKTIRFEINSKRYFFTVKRLVIPHYVMVYKFFAKWQKRGVWVKLHEVLRHKVRQKLHREEKSSVTIVDSQSVKTTEKGDLYGYDGGKKVKGIKRHLVVDSLGLVIGVSVINLSESVRTTRWGNVVVRCGR